MKQLLKRLLIALTQRLTVILPAKALVTIKANLNIVQRLDYSRHDILLLVDSDVEYDTRLHSCAKEPETIQWIERFMGKGDVVFDIGANVGAYSLVAAKYTGGAAKIYAVEPSFPAFAKLCRNIFLNGCQGIIIPLNIAFSDRTTIDDFNYSDLSPGAALHSFGKNINYKGETFIPVLKQPIVSYRIDDLITQFGIPIPNHMKLDVDGIELSILKGADATLRNNEIKSVLVEVDERRGESDQIIKYMTEKGFKLEDRYQYVYGGETTQWAKTFNYLFVRVWE